MTDDPIGTVRREDFESGHSIWVRLDSDATPGNEWSCVWSAYWSNIGCTRSPAAVADDPIIGAVPGTPAAAGLLAEPAAQPVEAPFTLVLDVFVPGRPAPQGSKRHVGNGIMIESSKALPAWREAVRWTAVQAWSYQKPPIDGPVLLTLEFVLPRPLSTPKRRTPPATKKPDTSKLIRAVEDALTDAGVWRDDSLVVDLHATKRIAEIGEAPGCRITIHTPVSQP